MLKFFFISSPFPKKMKSFQEIFFKFKFSMEILEQLTELHLKSIPLRLETFLARLGSLKNLLNFGEFSVFKVAKWFIIFFQYFLLIFQIYACTLNCNIYIYFFYFSPSLSTSARIDWHNIWKKVCIGLMHNQLITKFTTNLMYIKLLKRFLINEHHWMQTKSPSNKWFLQKVVLFRYSFASTKKNQKFKWFPEKKSS